MNRNVRNVRFFTLVLLGIILIVSSIRVTARQQLLGQLTIDSNSGTSFITMNGELTVSGSTVLPATEIVTPGESTAKISFGKAGQIKIAPNSKMNLNFSETTISSVFSSGQLTMVAAPNIGITIQTTDGVVTNPDQSKNSVITVDFVNGKTRVRTQLGTAAFNGTPITEGQTFSEGTLTNHPEVINSIPGVRESSLSNSFVSAIFTSFLRATHIGNVILDTNAQAGTSAPEISNFGDPHDIISRHN